MTEPPRFDSPRKRTELDWRIDDAWHRMMAATTPESLQRWAREYVRAKRARGDYPIIQDPITDDMVDALARQEAQANVMNLEGERCD